MRSGAAMPAHRDVAVAEMPCQLGCNQCHFFLGFHGHLRRGKAKAYPADPRTAWCRIFTLKNPETGKQEPWLDGHQEGGDFKVSCRVCSSHGAKGHTRELPTGRMHAHRWSIHEKSRGHQEALASLKEGGAEDHVTISGISESVPRLDRWVRAAGVVAGRRALRDETGGGTSGFAPDLPAGEVVTDEL